MFERTMWHVGVSVNLISVFVVQIVGNLIRTFGEGWEEEIPRLVFSLGAMICLTLVCYM